MGIEFVLTAMGLVYCPAIVLVGILYLFNRRIRAKRILQEESENVNETVLFAGNRLMSAIYINGSLPVAPLGMPKGVDDFVREHVKPKEA